MSDTPTTPLGVHGVKIRNFKRLQLVDIGFKGSGIFEIRGRNAQGKSSLIDGLFAALGGTRNAPDRPIRDGESRADVEVNLGDLVVRRSWNGNGTKLEVLNKAGQKIGSPQTVLDSLCSQFIDPVQFLNLRPEDQAERVLGMAGLGEDLAKLEAEESEATATRRDLGKDLKRVQGALDQHKASLPELPENVLSLDDAIAAMRAASEADKGRQLALAQQADAETRLREREQEVERLTAALEAAKAGLPDLVEAAAKAKQLTDSHPSVDLEAAQAAVELAQAQAEAMRAHQLDKDLESDLAVAKRAHDDAEARVAAIRNRRAKLMAAAAFPVEGMSYDADDKALLLGGLPFKQASAAERLKAAIELAIAGSPGMRVLFVRDASLLDAESRGYVEALAKERGFLVLLEIVGEQPGSGGVFIEDGLVAEPEEVSA